MMSTPSVIVREINVTGVAVLKTKDHPPISAHKHRPEAFVVAGQWVKPEPWNIHVLRGRRGVEPRKDALDFPHKVRPYSAAVAALKEPSQSTMLKASNHKTVLNVK
jgi:hypothetical protein